MSQTARSAVCRLSTAIHYALDVTAVKIGSTRCSTEKQDVKAHRQTLRGLRLPADQARLDLAYSGTNPGRHVFDRGLTAMRIREGMTITRATGWTPKLSPTRQAHLPTLSAAGEHTITEQAELFAGSRPRIARDLESAQTASSAV